MNETRIKIPLSKSKIVLLNLGALAFVLAGVWLIRMDFSSVYSFIGVISILFFGACGIFGVIKLFDGKMGLIIDSKGIWDNSSAASIGLIRWEDIKRFDYQQIEKTEILIIYVKNPEEYIKNTESRKKALLLKVTQKMYGTPFTISSVALKIKFKELEKIVKVQFAKYKKNRRKRIDRRNRRNRRNKKLKVNQRKYLITDVTHIFF